MTVPLKKVQINVRKDGYYTITIPKALIDNGILSPDKSYDVNLKERREQKVDPTKTEASI